MTQQRVKAKTWEAPEGREKRMAARPPKPPTCVFPYRSVLIVVLCATVNCYTLVNLFPYVGMMVTTLLGLPSTNEAGYYGGYVASAFTFGRFLSGYAWGHVSDEIGRKPVLIIGLSSTVVFSLVFGLSPTYAVAITSRFMIGMTNGIMPASRTCVRELCRQEHAVMGLTYLGGCRGVALVVGTGIGGLLADPALNYPAVFSATGIFARHPYLLPNLFGAGFALIALVLVLLWLPETKDLVDSPAEHDSNRRIGDAGQNLEIAIDAKEWLTQTGETSEACAKLCDNSVPSTAEEASTNGGTHESLLESGNLSLRSADDMQEAPLCGRKGMLCNSTIATLLFIACVAQMMAIGYDEVFPLWALSTPDVGGLGWGIEEIGKVLLTAGNFLVVVQLVCIPRLMHLIGVVKLQRAGCLMAIATFLAFSNVGVVSWNNTSLFVALVVMNVCINSSMSAVNIGLTIASTNAVPPHHRGKLSGLYNTAESLGRFTGPVGYATAFAHTISPSAEHWRLVDYHSVFYASAAVMAVVSVLCWRNLTSETMTKPSEPAGAGLTGPVVGVTSTARNLKASDPICLGSETLALEEDAARAGRGKYGSVASAS